MPLERTCKSNLKNCEMSNSLFFKLHPRCWWCRSPRNSHLFDRKNQQITGSHPYTTVYRPYTIRIPCQDPSRIPPYTVRIPAVYHPYTMPGSQPYTTVYRPYTSRIPSVYHHGPRLHYRPYTTRIPHRPHPPSPCFQVLFFSFPLSSFQGLKQGLTNKRRRKFCGAMGNVQSWFLSRLYFNAHGHCLFRMRRRGPNPPFPIARDRNKMPTGFCSHRLFYSGCCVKMRRSPLVYIMLLRESAVFTAGLHHVVTWKCGVHRWVYTRLLHGSAVFTALHWAGWCQRAAMILKNIENSPSGFLDFQKLNFEVICCFLKFYNFQIR